MGFLFEIIFALVLILYTLYRYLKNRYNYWKKKGVPYKKPIPLLGNFYHVLFTSKSVPDVIKDLYNCPELNKKPFGGVFSGLKPALIIRDPELIKFILIKDFQFFKDRNAHRPPQQNNLLSNSLFQLYGWRWRSLRSKLTPAFSSGKLKLMFHLMIECCEQLEHMLRPMADKELVVDIKENLSMFTTDIIGSCAFGLSINSMNNPDNEFRRMGRRVFKPSRLVNIQRSLLTMFPFLLKYFKSTVAPQSVFDFFTQLVSETVRQREIQQTVHNDFIQLLINIKNEKISSGEKHLNFVGDKNKSFEITENVIAAQAFIFFLAGFETSSTAMSFILHELAQNREIQKKLADEIESVFWKYGNKITYEALQSMKYMDQVVSEGLRKYPPLASLRRRCNKSYFLEPGNLLIEKGTDVLIPVFGLHYDPKYYPDPEKFDPDRFSPENRGSIHPCAYLPFGEGPRRCIGMRFGQIQTKVGLATLLHRYQFELCEKSTVPTKFDVNSPVTTLKGGFWVKIKKRHCNTSLIEE